jgi:hypothetical protein
MSHIKTIRNAIDTYFGDYKALEVAVMVDPDDMDSKHTSITIVTDLSDEESYKRLKHFDSTWWLAQPIDLRRQFVVSVVGR